MNFDEDENKLRWPRELFIEEAAALFNQGVLPMWDARCALLLEEAFVGGADSEPARHFEAQTSMWSQAWGQSPAVSSQPTPRLLADLIKNARHGEIQEQTFRVQPYWSQRKRESRGSLPQQSVAALQFTDFVSELEARGYLEKAFGKDCPDDAPTSEPSRIVTLRSGRSDLWPLDSKLLGNDFDALCDAVEVLHDLVSRPRNRVYHSFDDCGWHYSEFSSRTGSRVYRWRVNLILEHNGLDVRIAETGDDVGRMVVLTDVPRSELVESAATSSGASGESVRHAIALFRKRGADEHDKRSAIVTLAGVLEKRRDLLKRNLLTKDEGALFEIANKFNLRHQAETQKENYNPVFLDWIFWWYLATVELTNRLQTTTAER